MSDDTTLAQEQAMEQARAFWAGMSDSFQSRRQRGRAVVNQVVRDNGGRTVGALASIDGSSDQPILIDHGQAMTTGDVFVVVNDGTASVPQWRTIRRVQSAAAIPQSGELPSLPTVTGFELYTGAVIGAPGIPVMPWVGCSWDILDSAMWGGHMDYEVEYSDDANINNPLSQRVNYQQPTTFLQFDIQPTDTIIPRTPYAGGIHDFDKFPWKGKLSIRNEFISYEAATSQYSWYGENGISSEGMLIDQSQNWPVNFLADYVLIDSNGDMFLIIGNDEQAVFYTGTAASGAYYIYPCFSGCSRGIEGTTAQAHAGGDAIISESAGIRIGLFGPGLTYQFRVRALRYDGAVSGWTPWQSIAVHQDNIAPPTPEGFTVTSTMYGILLEWTGPTIVSCPDLIGFWIWESDDAAGTNERFRSAIGPRTDALVFTNSFNDNKYYCIQAIDSSGNASAKTERLPGKKQATVGVNMLPNADFEIVDDVGTPLYWFLYEYGAGYHEYGDYGLAGGKGVKVHCPKTAGTGYSSSSVRYQCPYPRDTWLIHAELNQPYTCSFYYKLISTDIPQDEENFTYDAQYWGGGDGLFLISASVFMHNGVADSGVSLYTTIEPAVISETGDGWKRVQFNFYADPNLWNYLDYYYVGMGIGIYNRSETYDLVVHLDRFQMEIAAEATAWAAGAFAPPGGGLRIDPSGIVGPLLYIQADGSFGSSIIPTYDYTYDLGSTDRRWNTIRCNTLIAENIQDMGGTPHEPVTIFALDQDVLAISEAQVLMFQSQVSGLVFASPATVAGTPNFIKVQSYHVSQSTPSGLAVDSSNVIGSSSGVAVADHTHAIASASSPGATASILATSSAGDIDLGSLVTERGSNKVKVNNILELAAGGSITTPSGNLTVSPGGDLYLNPAGDNVFMDGGSDIGTDNWVSGYNGTGWKMTFAGELDARQIYAEELVVDAFTTLVSQVHNGALYLTKAVAEVSRNFSVPSVNNSGTLYVWDLPGYENTQIFSSGDWVLLRYVDRSGGGLVVGEAWGQVTNYTDRSGGEQSYTFTTKDTTTSGITVYAGTAALDYGVSGQGVWMATVIHPNSPYTQIQTWSGTDPYSGSFTTWVRTGDLSGIAGGFGYGLYAGNNTTNQYFLASSAGFEIHGIEANWYDQSGNQRIGIDPTASTSLDSLLWAGPSSSDKRFEIRADGKVFVRDSVIIGTGTAVAIDGAMIYSPFDGPTPFEDNYGVNVGSQEGVPYGTYHVVGMQGKFGKAAVFAEYAVNRVRNPVAGATGNYAAVNGASVSRSSAYVKMGPGDGTQGYSYRVITDANAEGIRLTLDALTNEDHWCTYRIRGDRPPSMEMSVNNSTWRTPVYKGVDGDWDVYGYEFSSTECNGQSYLYIRQDGSGSGDWYLDCVQIESTNFPTPPLHGGMGDGYGWNGTAHASRSIRNPPYLTYSSRIPGTGSISVWLYPTADMGQIAQAQYIVTNSSSSGVRLWIDSSDNLEGAVGGADRVSQGLSSSNWDDFHWHHVAFTWSLEDNETHLYLDGVLVDTGTCPSVPTIAETWHIGSFAGSSLFNGGIDDLLIMDRVLTEEEVSAIANAAGAITYSRPFSLYLTRAGAGWIIGSADGIIGYNSSAAEQFKIDTETGSITAGAGAVVMNANGLSITGGTAQANRIKFFDTETTPNEVGYLIGRLEAGGVSGWNITELNVEGSSAAYGGKLRLYADAYSTGYAQFELFGESGGGSYASLNFDGTTALYWDSTHAKFYQGIRVGGGLYVGSTTVAPGTGNIYATNNIAAFTPSTPYYGVAIDMQSSGAGWARRFGFWYNSSTHVFSYGCYGSGSSLVYGWMGSAYDGANSYVRVYNGGLLTLGGATGGLKAASGYAALSIYNRGGDGAHIVLRNTDVAHGMTTNFDTDGFAYFRKIENAYGGLMIHGITEGTWGVYIEGVVTNNNTTKSTSAAGAVTLNASLKSGTTYSNMGTDANLVIIRDYSTCRFIFDKEGSAHADVNWTTFDDHDDVAMLSDLQTAMAHHQGDGVRDQFVDFLKYNQGALEEAGIVHFDRDNPGHAMVNFTKLSMLLTGAILQLSQRQVALEKRLMEA